ncbi:MAG: S-layer homology domain-containing protein, partial [Clostridia bacterium]|nr:S-layer homology domain-containing protein [Clostridia bacterium]
MKKTICLILTLITVFAVIPLGSYAAENAGGNRFEDVPEGKWYSDAVAFCKANGYMSGVAKDIFGVNETVTRAMVVTVLWRMAGSPANETVIYGYENPFTDITENKLYTPAVYWAYKRGFALGVTPDRFGPNAPATREQIVTILRRFAQDYLFGLDMDARASLEGYTDVRPDKYWATESLSWAVAN